MPARAVRRRHLRHGHPLRCRRQSEHIDGAVRLARWLVDNGNDGLVLAGTTGEATTLSDAEKADLWRAVRDAVSVPVIAGTGTASTAHSVELTKVAAAAGANLIGRDHLILVHAILVLPGVLILVHPGVHLVLVHPGICLLAKGLRDWQQDCQAQ